MRQLQKILKIGKFDKKGLLETFSKGHLLTMKLMPLINEMRHSTLLKVEFSLTAIIKVPYLLLTMN